MGTGVGLSGHEAEGQRWQRGERWREGDAEGQGRCRGERAAASMDRAACTTPVARSAAHRGDVREHNRQRGAHSITQSAAP